MRFRFEYRVVPHWPGLAWLARCVTSSPCITVFHGNLLEIEEEFFCEAIWADAYAAGNLDTTDIVSGSGARLRENRITFVSSGSTLDRLNALRDKHGVSISNSLACLLSATGGEVDPCYRRYYQDFYSIVHGLDKYERELATSAGSVEFVYFNNLAWDGTNLTVSPKPGGQPDLGSFEAYRGFLETSMGLLAENLSSANRRRPYTMLATVSTGYDSPTVAALARRAGCREAICFDQSHKGENDSGEAIAACLGIAPIRLEDGSWRNADLPEVPFLASNGMGEEVRFKAAEPFLTSRVLLTGYHGDKMWDKHTKALGPTLVRGDPSGSALTEYRLWAGFIHCPVPFLGVRQIRDVNKISNSPELAPWDVGGDYSRPICRRIVEGSGVPRELFGTSKRNASVMLHNYDDFLTPSSMRDFLDWLKAHRTDWMRHGRLPPLPNAAVDRAIHAATGSFCGWAKRKRGLWRLAGRLESSPTYLRKFVFPWAIERTKERYRPAPEGLTQS